MNKSNSLSIEQKQAQSIRDPYYNPSLIPSENLDESNITTEQTRKKLFALISLLKDQYVVPKISEDFDRIKRKFQILAELETQTEPLTQDALLTLFEDSHQEEEKSESLETQYTTLIHNEIQKILRNKHIQNIYSNYLNQEMEKYKESRGILLQVSKANIIIGKVEKEITQTQKNIKKSGNIEYLAQLQNIKSQQESLKHELFEKASNIERAFLYTQKLLEYKKQMKNIHFVLTPSRKKLINTVIEQILSGKKVLLQGPVGTGKTELSKYILNMLSGKFEVISWGPTTNNRTIFGKTSIENENGNLQSKENLCGVAKAMKEGIGVLHEEVNNGDQGVLMGLKFLLNARVGDTVSFPGIIGETVIQNGYFDIYNANPKDLNTSDRQHLDDSIRRLLQVIEVSYMPQREACDIILATLIDETGVLPLSIKEMELVKSFCKAAEITQECYRRNISQEYKDLLQISETSLDSGKWYLSHRFFDTGTLVKIFSGYSKNHAKGYTLAEHLEKELELFFADLELPKEERETIVKILQVCKVIGTESKNFKVLSTDQKYEFTLPSKLLFSEDSVEKKSDNPFGTSETHITDDQQNSTNENHNGKEYIKPQYINENYTFSYPQEIVKQDSYSVLSIYDRPNSLDTDAPQSFEADVLCSLSSINNNESKHIRSSYEKRYNIEAIGASYGLGVFEEAETWRREQQKKFENMLSIPSINKTFCMKVFCGIVESLIGVNSKASDDIREFLEQKILHICTFLDVPQNDIPKTYKKAIAKISAGVITPGAETLREKIGHNFDEGVESVKTMTSSNNLHAALMNFKSDYANACISITAVNTHKAHKIREKVFHFLQEYKDNLVTIGQYKEFLMIFADSLQGLPEEKVTQYIIILEKYFKKYHNKWSHFIALAYKGKRNKDIEKAHTILKDAKYTAPSVYAGSMQVSIQRFVNDYIDDVGHEKCSTGLKMWNSGGYDGLWRMQYLTSIK